MNARIFGLIGLVAALAAACKNDPTAGLVGTPSRVDIQFKTLRVTVGDSTSTFAVVRDADGTALPRAITITACNPATVAVSSAVLALPLPQTKFTVHGVLYGIGCVVASYNGLVDTVQVASTPDHIVVSGGPDTVVSGVPTTYSYTWVDKNGAAVAGVPAPNWTTGNAVLGTITDAVAGTYVGADTGVGSIVVADTISLLNASIVQTYTANKVVATIAAPFNGTNNSPVQPGGNLILTANAGGPAYDATTTVWFGPNAQTTTRTGIPTTVSAAVLDLAAWGPLSMGLKGIGPLEVTQVGLISVTTPPQYAGTLSSTTVRAGQLVTITAGGGDPAFGATSRVYWNSNRAWIVDTTAGVAHVALPPSLAKGKHLLLFTRMAATGLSARDTITSADSLPYDQYDVVSAGGSVQNGPDTGPIASSDTSFNITFSGTCTNGGPDAGGSNVQASANCDDFVRVHNTKGVAANVTVTVNWQPKADLGITTDQDIDVYWFPDNAFLDGTFAEFCVIDGCASASAAKPETSTVSVPAGATYYIFVNYFNGQGRPYSLVQVKLTGLN